MSLISQIFQIGLNASLEAFFRVLPVVLLLGLVAFLWRAWMRYIQSYFLSRVEWVVLEITLPKETFKSPKAMEVVLGAFHQAPGINVYEQYFLGYVRPWASLEIASIDGHVHFFIRTFKKYRIAVETHIYSQYPTAEIHEVQDYVYGVPYLTRDSGWQLFGSEFKFSKEDGYPIKTYVDYGLDKDPKEEFKVDPMTSALEFMGSVGKGEQVWFQIVVMAAQKRFRKPGTFFEMQDWVGDAKTLLDKLMKRDKLKEAVMLSNEILLSPGERSIVEAIERQISKLGFDCGIRIIYLAEKDKFNPANISGLMAMLRQYNSLNLNGFKAARYTAYDPWQDPFGKKLPRAKEGIFEAYCNRGWFYPPYSRLPFVLNTEELATIYHFPGAVAATPTFARAESKRGEAPINLPI